MSSSATTIQSLMQRLEDKLPPALKSMLHANVRSHLLARIDTVLMVFDSAVYDLANNTWRNLQIEDGTALAQSIAIAAEELLAQRQDKPTVLLLLPSQEFIATQVNMPGVARENLRSALALQSAVLLPSYEQTLSFTVNPSAKMDDAADTVLWTSEAKLNALFNAFADRGLFLTAVMPRVLAATDSEASGDALLISEEDATHLTRLVYREGVLAHYCILSKQDIIDEEFKAQWQEQCLLLETEAARKKHLRSAQDYLDIPRQVHADPEYCFIPSSAREVSRQAEKGKRMGYLAIAAAVVIFLSSTPFLWQSFQMMRLESNLQALQVDSAQAREDQARVREFELSWGVLNEFPRQNISQTLLELQTVLNPSVLTSIEIDEGTVEIEGESPDPQSLLQQLEQNTLFTGVDFARATNNNRYFIELSLSTVDYDAYRQWYFPDVRR